MLTNTEFQMFLDRMQTNGKSFGSAGTRANKASRGITKCQQKSKDPRLARAGVSGFNKPKRTPSHHPKKSHVVVAKEGDKV